MKRIRLVVSLICFSWCALALAAVAKDAEELVKSTADQVTARVKNERAVLRKDSVRLHQFVDELIIPHFDFARMSQWVLGKHWRSADAAQRSRFIEEFRKLLVKTYATALLEYADRETRYFPVRADTDATLVTVRTEIEQPGSAVVPINYRMHVKNNAWKVFDVSVDGVSLVATYRASFASEIRKSGIDSLIKSLETKNEKK